MAITCGVLVFLTAGSVFDKITGLLAQSRSCERFS